MQSMKVRTDFSGNTFVVSDDVELIITGLWQATF